MTLRVLLLLVGLAGFAAGENWTYYIEPCRGTDLPCQPGDPQLAEWALERWAKTANGELKWRRVNEPAKARLKILWQGVRDDSYGEMRPVPFGKRNGAELYVRPDMKSLGGRLARTAASDRLFRDTVVYLTCLHETGHALGLSHTGDEADIMYSFGHGGDIVEYFMRFRRLLENREDIRNVSAISKQDQNRLFGALSRAAAGLDRPQSLR